VVNQVKTVYDVQQVLKKFGTFIYSGDRIGDLELMEMEIDELFSLQFIEKHIYIEAKLILRQEVDKDVNLDDQKVDANDAADSETEIEEEIEAETEKNNEGTSESEDSPEEKIVNYSLNIKSGMPTSMISSQLAEYKIIDNATEFTNYLNGYLKNMLIDVEGLKDDCTLLALEIK